MSAAEGELSGESPVVGVGVGWLTQYREEKILGVGANHIAITPYGWRSGGCGAANLCRSSIG